MKCHVTKQNKHSRFSAFKLFQKAIIIFNYNPNPNYFHIKETRTQAKNRFKKCDLRFWR